jgi:hypothetical protein
VGVDDLDLPRAMEAPQREDRGEVPLAAHAQLVHHEARRAGAFGQRRSRLRHHLRMVAVVAQSRREPQRLLLAAAPGALGVDVEDPHRGTVAMRSARFEGGA